MTELLVQARSVEKSYPDGDGTRQVLDDVHLIVEVGSIVGVQGPSGCGKTTLLKIVAGLIHYDAGSVHFDGNPLDFSDPRKLASTRRAKIGLVSQEYGLLEDESVAENIGLPLRFGEARPARRVRKEMVERASLAAALTVDQGRIVRTLSGGEKQRVAIARALVRTPRLLIADEPTAALDAATARVVLKTLRGIADSGAAVLLATHDSVVADACDRVYRFDGARLQQVRQVRI